MDAAVNRGRPSRGCKAARYTKGLKAEPACRRASVTRLNLARLVVTPAHQRADLAGGGIDGDQGDLEPGSRIRAAEPGKLLSSWSSPRATAFSAKRWRGTSRVVATRAP